MTRGVVRLQRIGRLTALACAVAQLCAPQPALAAQDTGVAKDAPWTRRLVERLDGLLSPRCLTPAAGTALSDLMAAGGLRPALGEQFTFAQGRVGAQQIEIEIRDRAQHAYTATLALPGARGGHADGRGRRFLFYLSAPSAPPDAPARAALLAIAKLCDAAVPDSALRPCAGADAPHTDRRYPRAFALTGAAIEVLIVAAAIVFGLRAIRP